MEVSSAESLNRVVQPHLQKAAERAVNLELLHLLSASPESSCSASSYEGSDSGFEDDERMTEESNSSRISERSQYRKAPDEHLKAIQEFSTKKKLNSAKEKKPVMIKKERSQQKPTPPSKQTRVVFGKSEAEGKRCDDCNQRHVVHPRCSPPFPRVLHPSRTRVSALIGRAPRAGQALSARS